MNLYFTLIIIILTIVCFILFTKYKLEKERYKNLKLSNENLDKLEIYNQNLKEELLKVKEQNILEKEDAFNRGFENGKRINSYEVQIHPYQDIFINKKTFSTEEVIKIGYKYILFINGLPFPNSHIEIIETISRKEISEERISEILNKISELTNLIPNANIQLIGSLSEFGKKLLNQKK